MKSLMSRPAAGDANYTVAADGSVVALPPGENQAALPGGAAEEETNALIAGAQLPGNVDDIRD